MVFSPIAASTFWGPALVIAPLALLWAAWIAPWRQLFGHSYRQHAFLAAVVCLALLWQLQVNILNVMTLHPLLIMSVVMVFGGALGLWVGALALLVGLLFRAQPLPMLAVHFCLGVLVPVLAACLVLQLIDRLPVKNLFVYMLGGGFVGGMLSLQAMAAVSWLYVWLLGPEPLKLIVSDHYYLTLMLIFPEGFLNGSLMSALTVLAPDLPPTNDQVSGLDEH